MPQQNKETNLLIFRLRAILVDITSVFLFVFCTKFPQDYMLVLIQINFNIGFVNNDVPSIGQGGLANIAQGC